MFVDSVDIVMKIAVMIYESKWYKWVHHADRKL